MVIKKLLMLPMMVLFMAGCHPAYLSSSYNANPAAGGSVNAANPDAWYWDNGCNCWVNNAYQPAPPVASMPIDAGPCGAGCRPTPQPALPAPPYCPPGSSCQTAPRAALPLIQTNATTLAPAPATTAATPQYWDPACQCWASARYVNTPSAVTAPPTPDTSAIIIARDAQRTAQQALQESYANTERLNRAYRRSLEK